MEKLGPDASPAVPFLIEYLKSDQWHRRQPAAIVLGSMGRGAKDGIPALCEAVASNDGLLRWYAAAALGDIGVTAADVINVLRRAERDGDVDVRFHAKAALLKLGHDGETLRHLKKHLKESDSHVRNAAVLALSYLGPRAAPVIPDVRVLVKTEDNPYIRRNAVEALAKMSGRSGQP